MARGESGNRGAKRVRDSCSPSLCSYRPSNRGSCRTDERNLSLEVCGTFSRASFTPPQARRLNHLHVRVRDDLPRVLIGVAEVEAAAHVLVVDLHVVLRARTA